MPAKTNIAVAAALVLASVFPASATTRWRSDQVVQPIAEAGTGSKYGPRCTASGGPECDTSCQSSRTTGEPCKEHPDGW